MGIGSSTALVLGFFVATAYGAGFHFVLGGPAKRIVLYVLAAWIGFAFGHFLGDFFNFEYFKVGTVHLLSASLGAWVALILSWWLGTRARPEKK